MKKSNKKYPKIGKPSEFTDKSESVTSIRTSDEIYCLYFAETQEYDEKWSFRFARTINNEIYMTPLLQSQYRKSIQYSEPGFFHRRWKDYLRLK